MAPIELTRLRCAQRGHNALGIPAKDGAVRHVGQACNRKRSRPHGVREVVVRGAFDVIPVLPPCVWTSTEMDLRRTSSAAEAASAVWAAAVEPRGPTSPASIAPTEASAVLHIQCRGERA